MDEEKLEEVVEETKKANNYLSIGWQVVGPVLAGVFLGLWLDKKFSPDFPLWTIILASLAIIVALYQLIRSTK